MLKRVDEKSFDRVVLDSDRPVVVKFFAEWCGPCKFMAPIVEEFANDNPHVLFVEVDIDKDPGLAQRFAIMSVPTMVSFKGGETVSRLNGFNPKPKMATFISGI